MVACQILKKNLNGNCNTSAEDVVVQKSQIFCTCAGFLYAEKTVEAEAKCVN